MRAGIALVGFMGSGKTTVGRALARRLGWSFVDLDDRLASRHGPIADQIALDGLGAFRRREVAAAIELCDGRARVLATGGGTWIEREARDALARGYLAVWLDAPLDVISARVGDGDGRPLWDERVGMRYEERRPLYATAPVRVDAEQPVERIVDQIVAAWSAST